MSKCLEELRQRPECPEDEVLVQQVRIQLVMEKSILSSWYDTTLEPIERLRIPQSFLIQTLYSQLEEVMASRPAHLLENSESPLKIP